MFDLTIGLSGWPGGLAVLDEDLGAAGAVARRATTGAACHPYVGHYVGHGEDERLPARDFLEDVSGGFYELADAMNVVTASRYGTNILLATDQYYRVTQPLSGHQYFVLLPHDAEG